MNRVTGVKASTSTATRMQMVVLAEEEEDESVGGEEKEDGEQRGEGVKDEARVKGMEGGVEAPARNTATKDPTVKASRQKTQDHKHTLAAPRLHLVTVSK